VKSDERVACQVGRALRRLRLDQDFLMKQVAGRAEITVSMLSLYEHGHRCPSLPNLVKILRALDCTAEEFGNTLGPWGCLP
jgi:transcriptional regulator with XRE-family HTH domain